MRSHSHLFNSIAYLVLVAFLSACAPTFPKISKEERQQVTREEVRQEKQTKDWIGFPILNAAAFGIMGLGLGFLIGLGRFHATTNLSSSIVTTGLVGVAGGIAFGTLVGNSYASELATIRAIETKKDREALTARIQALSEEIKKLDPSRDRKRFQEIQEEISYMKASLEMRKPK